MMSHDCWRFDPPFHGSECDNLINSDGLEGHQGAIDDVLGSAGRMATRSTTEALNCHWMSDSETPQDTSSIPSKGRGRNPRIQLDTTIRKSSLFNGLLSRKGNRVDLQLSQGTKARPADPPWLPNSCWPSSDAKIASTPQEEEEEEQEQPRPQQQQQQQQCRFEHSQQAQQLQQPQQEPQICGLLWPVLIL